MNLRKKKKRLKRQVESMRAELEQMTKPIVIKTERREIDTLTNVSYYHMHEYNSRCLRDIDREVAAVILHLMESYIEFNEELVDMGSYPMMKVTAKLRVVKPDGGDGI